MSKRIKGITIEIDGETKGLDKALKNINSSTRDIQKELRQVERLLKFNPKNTELLSQKQKLLAQNVEGTKKKLDALKQAQKEVNKAFQKGEISGKQYRDFQREIIATEGKLKNYRKQLALVDKSHRTFGDSLNIAGKKMQDIGGKLSNTGQTLTRNVTMPLAGIGAMATKTGMDFQATMSEVQAVSGATGGEIKQLEDKARELGASTKYSAQEVGEGLKYMALAGWSAQESLDGIPGVLSLATASGEDLATVSDIVTDAISAFGDKASDASRYADVLAATASNANTDVAGLGEAFKYVAPVAGALGYKVEDVAVALGLMANQGIKGSSSGTALRNVLTNLVSPTSEMEKAMNKYGISIKDSNDEIKPLDVLLTDLRSTFSDLTEDQKAQLASTLAGKEGMSGLLAVVNSSPQEFSKLTNAIKNSNGVADEMADVMGDNLKGKFTNLKSSIAELAIKLFEALEPALTSAVQWLQNMVDKFNDLSPSTQSAIVNVGLVVTAIGPLLTIGGKIVAGIGVLLRVIPILVAGISSISAPILVVIGVVTALVVAWKLLTKSTDDQLKKEQELAESNLKVAESQQETLDVVKKQQDATAESIEKTKDFIDSTDDLINSYEELTDKSKLNNDEFLEYLSLQSKLENTTTPEKVEEIKDRMSELAEKSGLSKDEFAKLILSNDRLAELFPELTQKSDDYGNAIAGTADKLRDLSEAELDRMGNEVYNDLISDLAEVDRLMSDYLANQERIFELEDNIGAKVEERKSIEEEMLGIDKEKEANNEIIKHLKEQQLNASYWEKKEIEGQIRGIESQNDELDEKKDKLEDNKQSIEKTIETEEKELKTLQKQQKEIDGIIEKNRDNYAGLLEILSKQFDINIEKGKEVETIDEAIGKRKTEIAQLEDKIAKEGDSNGELEKQVDKLKTENSQLEDIKGSLGNIGGQLENHNNKRDKTVDLAAKTNAQHQKQGGYQDQNNKKQDTFNKKVQDSNKEAENLNEKLSKDHDKEVVISQSKNPDEENGKWSQTITKVVNVIKGSIPKFADGTDYAPGGLSIVGEEGYELVEHRGKRAILNAGFYDIPRGAKIFPHNETVDMLRNGVADGIGRGVSTTKSLQTTSEDLNINITPAPVMIDGEKVGEVTFHTIDRKSGSNEIIKKYMRGV